MFDYAEKDKANCCLSPASESYKDCELIFLWEPSRA